jgi:hypothetical protein
MAIKTLIEDIAGLLRMELGESCAVTCPEGKVTVVLSRDDCEKNYGQICPEDPPGC